MATTKNATKKTTAKKTSATKTPATQSAARKASRGSGRRELIAPHGDKRYVRRNAQGEFHQEVEVSRSLVQDVRHHARTKAKPGQGDRGDHG